MRPVNEIEKLIRKIEVTPSVEMDKRTLEGILQAQQKSEKQKPAETQPKVWRIIMKRPITKIATVATVLVIVASAVIIFNYTAKPAYAIEQTIEANHSIRYLHIKYFDPSHEEPREIWLEFNEDGQAKNIRAHMPEWTSPKDGPHIVVWKDNKMQMWFERKNVLRIIEDKAFVDRFHMLAEEADPRLAVERFYKLHKQKQVEMKITEPSNKAEPIIVTATHLPQSPHYGWRWVLLVDQATKLVNAAEIYKLKNSEYQYQGLIEYYDYNQAIDEEMFTLDNLPEDVTRIDQTNQEVGLVQGNLSDEEIAVEVVRQFYQAMIAKDFVKATKLYEGLSCEYAEKEFGKSNYLRIVSIGKPIRYKGGFRVPCTIEVEMDGKLIQGNPTNFVGQLRGQPRRWAISG